MRACLNYNKVYIVEDIEMTGHYTILINKSSKKVMVLDNWKVRYNRMRKRVADWVNVLTIYSDIKFVMITLTYAPENNWEPNHIRAFIKSVRKVLKNRLYGYAWVAELQKRGVIHYHVMLVVPDDLAIGDELPYPDEAGYWPYGFTRTENARTPFYLVTYLGKEYQKDFSKFPKGIRVFAVIIRETDPKLNLRYQSLRLYQQKFVDEFGWSELNSLTRIRKNIYYAEDLSWEVSSFESSKESAVKKAESWEGMGHSWKGRGMFVEE
jgi:hypothetical protein